MRIYFSGNVSLDRSPEYLLKKRRKPDIMLTFFDIRKSKSQMNRLKNHTKKK